MAESPQSPQSPRHPKVGTVLVGYPERSGASRYPVFLQVCRVTKTGMLSCTVLPVQKSDKKGGVAQCCYGWDETPLPYKDMRKVRIDVLVKVNHKEAPLWCPSKRVCLDVWDGKPRSALGD